LIATADELEALARRLLARGPVSAHGVAQVRVLLTDASRPLYHPGARHGLRTAAARALHDLEVQLECW
jgi:hypothetical protein